MSWLLDTNVLSELRRPRPSEAVVRWFAGQPITSFHASVFTLAELSLGAVSAPDLKMRRALSNWIEDEIRPLLADRILPADEMVARAALSILSAAHPQGRSLPVADLMIGATAAIHGFTVVTRNIRDFAYMGVTLLNPWTT